MNATSFILQKLKSLKKDASSDNQVGKALVDKIQQIVLSKKFRKYSANETLVKTIHNAINQAVENQTPVQFLFPQGAYKLWRLPESPNVDWADLFFVMHIAKPLCEICAIHKPGVVFDFLVDDLIIVKMNNVPLAHIESYIKSLWGLIDFVKKFLPDNFDFKITGVSKLFDSEEQYWERVYKNLETTPLPELTDSQAAMIEMNVKLSSEHSKDTKWREKIMQLHNAHMAAKREPGYHLGRDDKILLFTTPLPSGAYVSIGTTKNSVAKHWCGVGALGKKDGDFEMTILPPSKIPANFETKWENVAVPGLDGDNFKKIRIL